MYLPFQQNPSRMMHLIVRTERDPMRLARVLQAKVWEVDPEQPVSFVRTMEEVPAWAMAEKRLTMQLLALFAGLATLLSAIGIYGVISYTVSQRTQEVGIRLALGAQTGDVEKMVLWEGLKLVSGGVCLGVAGAFLLTRFLSSQLFGVDATDVPSLLIACLVMTTAALIGCYIPARRATRLDPITALRCE